MARDRPTSRLARPVEHRGRLGHRGLDSSRLARASALAAIATRARIDGQPISDQSPRHGSGQPAPTDRIRPPRQHPGAACRKRLYLTLRLRSGQGVGLDSHRLTTHWLTRTGQTSRRRIFPLDVPAPDAPRGRRRVPWARNRRRGRSPARSHQRTNRRKSTPASTAPFAPTTSGSGGSSKHQRDRVGYMQYFTRRTEEMDETTKRLESSTTCRYHVARVAQPRGAPDARSTADGR